MRRATQMSLVARHCARPPASLETHLAREIGRSPYRNPNLSAQTRADDLVGQMTLQEKTAQLRAGWLRLFEDGSFQLFERMTGVGTDPRPFLQHGIGHITRPFGTYPIDPKLGARALNNAQKFLVEETRLGIPA